MMLQVETTLYQAVTLALRHKLKYLLTSMEIQIVRVYINFNQSYILQRLTVPSELFPPVYDEKGIRKPVRETCICMVA